MIVFSNCVFISTIIHRELYSSWWWSRLRPGTSTQPLYGSRYGRGEQSFRCASVFHQERCVNITNSILRILLFHFLHYSRRKYTETINVDILHISTNFISIHMKVICINMNLYFFKENFNRKFLYYSISVKLKFFIFTFLRFPIPFSKKKIKLLTWIIFFRQLVCMNFYKAKF